MSFEEQNLENDDCRATRRILSDPVGWRKDVSRIFHEMSSDELSMEEKRAEELSESPIWKDMAEEVKVMIQVVKIQKESGLPAPESNQVI